MCGFRDKDRRYGLTWTMRLRGMVDEVSVFGWRLRLERVLEFTPGQPGIAIRDVVRNLGGTPAPLMILYHCNFGWPLLSPDSEMTSPSTNIKPRDAAAEPGIHNWNRFDKSTPGYAEQVFFHYLDKSEKPLAASLVNKKLGFGVELSFDSRTLPVLTEWKQMGHGEYVLGIEPGNSLPIGRVKARELSDLKMLAPDESVTFSLGFKIIPA